MVRDCNAQTLTANLYKMLGNLYKLYNYKYKNSTVRDDIDCNKKTRAQKVLHHRFTILARVGWSTHHHLLPGMTSKGNGSLLAFDP